MDHVAAALAQDECSENYRKVVLGIDSPSLSGSNTGSINEMESPDMQGIYLLSTRSLRFYLITRCWEQLHYEVFRLLGIKQSKLHILPGY